MGFVVSGGGGCDTLFFVARGWFGSTAFRGPEWPRAAPAWPKRGHVGPRENVPLRVCAATVVQVPLQPLELPADQSSLPSEVGTFLAAAATVSAQLRAGPGSAQSPGFVASDYELVYRTLRTLRQNEPDLRRFCEWGSGLGVVAGLASQLGFQAYGIELDARLVAASQRLLDAHQLTPTIVGGSFVPASYRQREAATDLDARTVWSGPDAYQDLDCDLDDFHVIFAYPWPTEEEHYQDVFRSGADYGAILVTYVGTDGIRAFRKVGKRRR